ncbi:MAG: adenylate kinase [Acidobacteriota bacterium]
MAASSIVFLGPPNSGKGTQAARLASRLGIPAISTGEMLRGAVAAGSELGDRVKDVMNQGLLVSDELMAEVIEDRLGQADAESGFLLDGYPRTLPQVATLDSIMERRGSAIDHVVLIDVPQKVLEARAHKRFIELGRKDDRPEVVIERLEQYRIKTEPLVNHYRERGLLREIDGDQSMEAVEAAIAEAVGA